jgi:integrase
MVAGRPSQAPWTLGTVTTRKHPSTGGLWQARGRYRDAEGERFDATASGPTEGRARRALQAKVEEHRSTYRGGDATLNQDTTVARAGELWLEAAKRKRVRDKPLSPRTLEQYEANLRRYVVTSSIGSRRLAKANNVSVIEQWLASIADNHGNGAATSARRVLSNLLSHAERQGAIAASVMSRVRTPSAGVGTKGDRKCLNPECDLDCGKRHLDTKRAFTEPEIQRLFSTTGTSDAADITDLMHFLFGTGVRIREALEGVSWDDVDLERDTVHVRGTKTASADRILSLSTELAERLDERGRRWGRTGLVFGTTRFDTKLGQPREVQNVLRAIRATLTEAGLPWAGSHTFRRTVATWMDADGAPLAEIANQLGHADVNTTAGYLGRRQAPTRAATVMTLGSRRPALTVVRE